MYDKDLKLIKESETNTSMPEDIFTIIKESNRDIEKIRKSFQQSES